jgi:hypothetical protein
MGPSLGEGARVRSTFGGAHTRLSGPSTLGPRDAPESSGGGVMGSKLRGPPKRRMGAFLGSQEAVSGELVGKTSHPDIENESNTEE